MTLASTRIAFTQEDIDAAMVVRHVVFIEGQGVDPDLERDGQDGEAVHVVAEVEGRIIGTGRMLAIVSDAGTMARVGRMAVLDGYRRKGIGTRLLRELEDEAKRRGWLGVELHAQTYVQRLYARAGYRVEGEPFMEADIEHITMVKPL